MGNPDLLTRIEKTFLHCFYKHHRTVVKGGFTEPYYRAPTENHDGEIQYSHDYPRSALHEIAHWCVAGDERRKQDDYGYWYAPDGRNSEQQAKFYQVEVKPQAMEQCFCEALGIEFEVSCDNLDGPTDGWKTFAENVAKQVAVYKQDGLPSRAAIFYNALKTMNER